MRDLKKWILNDLMNEEAEEQINASRYERNSNRKDYRNGYKQRSLLTTDGKVILDKPQFRETSFHTAVFDNYSRVEKSVESIILESYLSGVSTRSVNKVIKSLGIEVSPSYVSSLSSRLDKTVNEFLERKIDGEYKFIYIDGTYLKIRNNGRYRNKAIYICVGINSDGYREVLGARIYDSETEIEWELFFDDLKDRGLNGVEMVISDGNKGIREAVKQSFPGSSWQYCHVHFMRNLRKSTGKQQWKFLSLLIKQALDNPDILPLLQDKLFDRGLDKCSTMFDKYYDSLYNYRSFNTNMQGLRRLRVSNTIERLNAEIKRRTKKIGAFPSDDSAMRLAGSIMMDINEEYVTGRKYINMEEISRQ
ncbi:IS256-like element ISFac7 family transposase, partial [Ferroplasma acidiphilum]|uniref:IS256 family transposase n=1 Tax=Ferroplasma acidiphilum TaxID=74969 RepID=A0A7K4FJS8_9ARCH|nr:IS256 family transposase [Ferroplasma acidiphilum]NOL59300.1 IS256 family transposase [Ferroplasma acidiphilum]